MKILVIGSNGGTGRQVLRQSLDAGHLVTALVRRPDSITEPHGQLRVVQGDVNKPESLVSAMVGQDAVISTYGLQGIRNMRGDVKLYSEGGRNIIQAMGQTGLKRLICVTSGGVESDDPSFGFVYKHIIKPLLLNNSYDDMKRFEAALRNTQLDWTIVRPSQLTDGPRTGAYRVSPRYAPVGGSRISRADLAEFILKQLTDNQFLHGTPTLAY